MMRTRNEEENSLDCVKSRTARPGFEKGISSARGKAEKTRDHGRIIQGEQEDDDTDEGDGFDDSQEEVCDDRTGEVLDAKDECWARTGGAPMSTKWVRVNQETSSNPIVRARLVANIFKAKGIYVGSHAVIGGKGIAVPHVRQGAARLSRRQMAKAEVDVH